MAIRISGLASGLDTESIVKQLVSAYSVKKDSYVKAQTKLSWKQDAWKTLNKKIYSLYGKIGNLRYDSAYNVKKATVSDTTKAKVTASGGAVNGVQSLKIENIAKAGYLTGGQLADGTTGDKTLSQLGYAPADGGSISVTIGGKTTDIAVDGNTTITKFVSDLNDAGVKASYDSANQRIFVSAKDTGKDNDFVLAGADANGTSALSALKLNVASAANNAQYKEWAAYALNTDGEAYYNEDGTTNGTYSDVKTKTNLTAILSEISDANDAIDSANNLITQNQAKITANKALISYAEFYQTMKSTETQASANGMSTDEIKSMSDLAQMSGSDLEKYYEVDSNGKLVYDTDGKPKVAEDSSSDRAQKGSDLLKSLEIRAGLTTTEGELDEDAATAYAESLQAVTAYEGNDTVDQAIVNKVHGIYAGSDGDYTDIAAYVTALNTENDASQGIIDTNNAIIRTNTEEVLDKYALVNNGQNADDLEARISYAISSLSRAQSYTSDAVRVNGEDSKIILNNATFTSSSNTYQINGLTIEALERTTGDGITITTQNDVDGVYNKVKDFIKQYNELINEMTSLYGAASAKGYEPLTSEEKDAMTDTEVEEWEKKIKDSLLRRDDTLGSVKNIMQSAMAKSFTINGKNYSLASFGIKTLGILGASEHEENAFHIDGDPDDSSTSGMSDKLKAMLQSDPESVTEFMKQLANGLYKSLDAKMKSTSLSSAYTIYNDKQMQTQYNEYTTTIKKWEDKVTAMEDSYYKKFAAMEKALSELQNSTSSLTGLFGS